LDHFGSVLVLELKQEISDRSLDVGEHGCSIYHTLSEHAEGDFHLELEFDPDTLREQIAPIVQQRNSPLGLEREYVRFLPFLMKIQDRTMR
jgi:hypothetical protein